jgi:hypothetical protein
MRNRSNLPLWLGSVVVFVLLTGCGSAKSSPDNPTSAGGLIPSIQDKEAGLVAVAPGFDIAKYKIVAIEKIPVTDPDTKDEGDRRFAAKMSLAFQLELVRRLRESGLFERVVNTSETEFTPTDAPALRLRGAITRLGRGSQAARYFGDLYGAGATRAQADMQFAEVASDRVVIVTADRRRATMGLFGGSDEEHLQESFDDIARDLVRFLVRLSKGEALKDAK